MSRLSNTGQAGCLRTSSMARALAGLACFLIVAAAQGAPAPAPAPAKDHDVAGRIAAAVKKPQPRLFLAAGAEAELKAKIDGDALLTKVYRAIASEADGMMDLKPVIYQKEGRRLLGRSRECLKRVGYLAFMHRLTGEARYLRRARQEMMAAAAFKDWNPSHFLDVAEMTAALGLGYDWLGRALDPEARDAIRAAIVEKGLKTSFASRWPVAGTNNWGQVCHGGLVIGALAVMDDEPELAAKVIERALANMQYPMKAYDPDGTYPEGPGYWAYGTSFNVLLIEALATGLGTDFEISQAPGFMQTGDYYVHAHGPTGLAFNYSDGGQVSPLEPAVFWFAARLNRPSLLWLEKRKLAGSPSRGRARGSSGRLLPFLPIWSAPLEGIDPPAELTRQGSGETAIAMHRDGWDARAGFVALKAGSPSASHGHMDIGSFVMEANGVRWAIDLGSQDYNSLESKGIGLWDGKQDGQRWSVFRLGSSSHNTLVVDGQRQRVAGFSKIITYAPDSAMPHSITDMSPAYEGQLARAMRGVGLLKGKAALVQDELKAPDKEVEVRWAMATEAKPALEGSRATLTQSGEKLELKVLEPAGARLEIYPTNPPPAKYDAPNPGTRMIGFKVKVAPGAEQRIVVLLAPAGSPEPEIKPLANW